MKESGLVKTNVDSIIYELLIMLLLISLCIFIVYFFRVKTIPLFEMIKNPGMYFKLNIMREKALKLLEVTIFEDYLFRWQRSFILPVGVIASLFLAVKYKLRKYMILFLIFLIAGIFINSLTLEKSPTAGIFLALMVFVYFRKNKINLKFLIGATILVFSGPLIIMYFLQFGRENILTVIALSFLYRIFIVPSEALYYYFEIFPKTHDFLYGRSTKLFSWLHDEGTFPISNYVAKIWWKNPYTSGLANVNFIGNYWVDFGWIGVILSCFVVGIIIHLFYWKLITISNYSKNIIYVTSICIISPIFTFGFFSVNFTILFFTTGLILLVVFLLMFNYIMKKIFNLKFGNIIKNSS